MISNREKMDIVIIGHVDHGKSTLVGRLLADTDSLPVGKLKEVKERCARNARPFEYAFLLDALKDEQSQGITIDSARCFFKSARREYILIDAPGHIEFLKNMISGAARAEAAVLVIDAHEGIQENSRRHGYLLGMLGISQVIVAVNKMDLVGGSRQVFETIENQYSEFLRRAGVKANRFIPISAINGDMVASGSEFMKWYQGPTILEALDEFEKQPQPVDQPLRLPVQDVYKFTEALDERRIVAGRINTGQLIVGDEVTFFPSGKSTRITSIETFNAPKPSAAAASQSVGITLEEQLFIQRGELVARRNEPAPQVSTQFTANVLWLKKEPMVFDKRYILKLSAARVPVWLRKINLVLDASELTTELNRRHIERHDVAECVLETLKPVAFDIASDIQQTGRFVLIDHYQIAGGGIILNALSPKANLIDDYVIQRQQDWRRSRITQQMRISRLGQRSSLVILSGPPGEDKTAIAQLLEEKLFAVGRQVFYLGINSGLAANGRDSDGLRDESIRRLGETAHLFTDAGLILIATITDLEDYELRMLKTLNSPGESLVVAMGTQSLSMELADLVLENNLSYEQAAAKIAALLTERNYLPEYYL